MENKSDYLESINILQDLNSDELEGVESQTLLMNYPSGHIFYMPEDKGEVLFLLKKGRVQLYRISTDGRKLVLAQLNAGAIFGHMALVGQHLHNTYAEALDDVVICVWGREYVEMLLQEKPDVAIRLLEGIGKRLSQVEDRLSSLTFKRAPARLAALLLNICHETNENDLQGYSHQYLADMIGTYRETATQILNDFRQQEIIDMGRMRICIRDSAKLQEIADGD